MSYLEFTRNNKVKIDMKYSMTKEIKDIVMPEARKRGVPWYELMDEIVLDYVAKRANDDKECKQGKTEASI